VDDIVWIEYGSLISVLLLVVESGWLETGLDYATRRVTG
jgi:hypothetical protein